MYISKSLGASYPNSFTRSLGATILSRSAILYNLHFLVGSKIVSLQNVGARSTSINLCSATIKIRLIIFLFRSYLHFNSFIKAILDTNYPMKKGSALLKWELWLHLMLPLFETRSPDDLFLSDGHNNVIIVILHPRIIFTWS